MSRRYTPEEKQIALQRLIANDHDIALTSVQTNIPQRTLMSWRAKYFPPQQPRQQLRGSASPGEWTPIPPLPGSDVHALREIKRQLMNKIHRLSHSIDEVVDEAPLIQRATALTQFINSVIKISAQIPPDPQDEFLEGEDFDDEIQYAQTPSRPDQYSH